MTDPDSPADRPAEPLPSSDPALPAPAEPPAPTAPLQLRASDADRERLVAVLREAYAEGRLGVDEYSERMDAAYRARTYSDLVPLVHDLPVPPGALPVPVHAGPTPVPMHPVAPPAGVAPRGAWGIEVAPPGAPVPAGQPAVAVFAGAERRGRFVVPERTSAVAVFGGVELDLSEAVLAATHVEITAVAVFGGIEIVVPHGVAVDLQGFAIFGGREAPRDTVIPPPGAPVITVSGFAMFGGIEVRRPKVSPAPPLPPGSAPPALPGS